MTMCIYDNPKTMRREIWEDGKLCWFRSANDIIIRCSFSKIMKGLSKNLPEWSSGKFLEGNEKAMKGNGING